MMIDKIRSAVLVVAFQILLGCMSPDANPNRSSSQFASLERVQLVHVAPRIQLYVRTGEVFRDNNCLMRANDLLGLSIAEYERPHGDQNALSDGSGGDASEENEETENEGCDEGEDNVEDDEDVLYLASPDEYLIYRNGERMCVLGVASKDKVVCAICPSEVRELESGYLLCFGLGVYNKYYRDNVLPALFCKEEVDVEDDVEDGKEL